MSETPDVKKIEQVIREMTPELFSALCAELGLIEAQLGEDRAEQTRALIERIEAAPGGLPRLARTIRHVWPDAFEKPVKPRREISIPIGPLLGIVGLIAIVAVAAIILINAVNPNTPVVTDFKITPSLPATQIVIFVTRTPTPITPTPTDTPTLTPTPDVDATLTATYAPSPTPTPAATATRTPRPTSNATSAPTSTPQPAVSLIYQSVKLDKPPSNSIEDPNKQFQMGWILPNSSGLISDERFRLRIWLNNRVVFETLTSNPWYDWFGAPNGQVGAYQWSVSVVRVDDQNKVLGPLSPDSELWNITWQTK